MLLKQAMDDGEVKGGIINRNAKAIFHGKKTYELRIFDIFKWVENGSKEGESHYGVVHIKKNIQGKKL